MENTILSRLQKAIPDGCSSAECLERVCQEVTYDVVSELCKDTEILGELKKLCNHLRFPIRTQAYSLPVPSKESDLPVKEGIGYALCGISYYLFYNCFESHWAGGIACIGTGLLYNRYMKKKERKVALDSSPSKSVRILSTDEELAKEIEQVVGVLANIIRLSEDALENKYYSILRYLYDDYIGYLSEEHSNKIRMKSLENILKRFGYELTQYTEEKASNFESSLATTVTETTTSIPALVNKKTDVCVFKGHVLFPKK